MDGDVDAALVQFMIEILVVVSETSLALVQENEEDSRDSSHFDQIKC